MNTWTHNSYWQKDDLPKPHFKPLEGMHSTEILIIGAGITGLSTAVELLERGHRVLICEAETIGAGTTGGSSGHLDAHPEMGTVRLLKQLGEADARVYTALRLKAIERIASRACAVCDYTAVPGFYYSESSLHFPDIRESFEAAQRIGLDVTWHEQVPIKRAASGYRVENLARMDSLAYVRRLAEQVIELGGQIFEQTLVAAPVGSHPTSLQTSSGGTVHFEQVVCAVHCNYTDSMRLYLETPAYQSYCLVAKVAEPPLDALFWDDSEPYFYIRRVGRLDENLVLVGGRDHRTGAGDESEAQASLERWLRERFDVQAVVAQWSAELFEPTDGLPLIGRVVAKENVWIVTGLSGIGLTWGTAAGEIISDLLAGQQPSQLIEKLSPSRMGLAGMGKMLGEQATAAANYSERILPADSIDPSQLQAGQGAVGKVNGTFVAVCRDRQGCQHRSSPICTHMGGVVRWNETAQTWDCPVHGGRFAADGRRLYGPPEERLDPPEG